MQNLPTGISRFEGGVYQGKGVGWPIGVDSFSHVLYLNELQLRWLENAVTQGGFVQTRPGYKTRLTFDTAIQGSAANEWWQAVEGPIVHPQMMVRFRPTNGQQQLVFAISGSIFFSLINSDGSLSTPQWITSFQFNPNADLIVGTPCIQSASIIGGQYVNNIAPRNLLIIQDGVSRAGIWDGLTGVHANPAKRITTDSEGGTLYPEAWNQTRIGLWMAWSGNRLWVSNGPNVYASDLNDPTHFTEELQLQSLPVLTFEDDVTGMIDRGTSGNNRSQVVIFTATTTETAWSGIQNRIPNEFGVGWAYTPDFRTKIFDAVGCVAGKSVIVHRGILYWKSAAGIVLFDSTQTVNSSQNLPPIDQEMAYSKMRISPPSDAMDLTCAGRLGSYVWWSVPVGKTTQGRIYNSHTQVLDRQTTVVRSVSVGGAFQAGTTGWQGVWTGIRPVQWANARVGGQETVYAISIDSEGAVHIWQAFQANRADNGQRIPWFVETRTHPIQPTIFEYGTIQSFKLMLDQIYGNVSINGMFKGLRGRYHSLLDTTITATPGSAFTPLPGVVGLQYPVANYGVQSRIVNSKEYKGVMTDCNSQNVESKNPDSTDAAFALAIRVTGRAALTAYQIFTLTEPQPTGGTGLKPTGISEDGFNIVPQGGCPSHIDGTTPDYTALDTPPQNAVSPYQPVASVSLEYEAPVV
jgi:hypothetical protein